MRPHFFLNEERPCSFLTVQDDDDGVAVKRKWGRWPIAHKRGPSASMSCAICGRTFTHAPEHKSHEKSCSGTPAKKARKASGAPAAAKVEVPEQEDSNALNPASHEASCDASLSIFKPDMGWVQMMKELKVWLPNEQASRTKNGESSTFHHCDPGMTIEAMALRCLV